MYGNKFNVNTKKVKDIANQYWSKQAKLLFHIVSVIVLNLSLDSTRFDESKTVKFRFSL